MSQDNDTLASLLEQELTLAVQLHQLMEQEHTALGANDLQALQELQPQSARQVEQLRNLASDRLQWMKDRQLPLASSCLDHPSLQPAANLRRLWQMLEEQYLRNQKLSEILSEIVLTARFRTQQKLKILRGQQNDPHLYNDKGKASSLKQGQGYIQV